MISIKNDNVLIGHIDNLQSQINTLSTLCGGGALNTTAKTLVGGINELNTKFANYLPLTGGTLSGSITAPILNGHLSNGAAYPRGKTDLPYHEVLT